MDTRIASKCWTSRWLVALVTVLIGVALAVQDADARLLPVRHDAQRKLR